ncbi:ArsR family transcriptional regulator [Devosia geojensis]|uniref:ArsR family transcriptional regulator n=1 Tax=Devosia geojensis TaxID=443610 RepID=A0A0F5FQN0_9HYPH|nr:metalloregulator ArsR/SmtB family transcription factor [Devosia geojensis]KKB11156.1 ArsR family transcriptional regulator [Devosia geojensis]
MDTEDTIAVLSAIAQPTRLAAFRLLARAEPRGISAGDLARRLDVPQNTLSSHLAVLAQAGLVRGERRSRSIIYRPDLSGVREAVLFLLADCCDGRPEICAPVRDTLSRLCQPDEEACCK